MTIRHIQILGAFGPKAQSYVDKLKGIGFKTASEVDPGRYFKPQPKDPVYVLLGPASADKEILALFKGAQIEKDRESITLNFRTDKVAVQITKKPVRGYLFVQVIDQPYWF